MEICLLVHISIFIICMWCIEYVFANLFSVHSPFVFILSLQSKGRLHHLGLVRYMSARLVQGLRQRTIR